MKLALDHPLNLAGRQSAWCSAVPKVPKAAACLHAGAKGTAADWRVSNASLVASEPAAPKAIQPALLSAHLAPSSGPPRNPAKLPKGRRGPGGTKGCGLGSTKGCGPAWHARIKSRRTKGAGPAHAHAHARTERRRGPGGTKGACAWRANRTRRGGRRAKRIQRLRGGSNPRLRSTLGRPQFLQQILKASEVPLRGRIASECRGAGGDVVDLASSKGCACGASACTVRVRTYVAVLRTEQKLKDTSMHRCVDRSAVTGLVAEAETCADRGSNMCGGRGGQGDIGRKRRRRESPRRSARAFGRWGMRGE